MRRLLALEGDVHSRLLTPWGDPDSEIEARRQRVLVTCDAFVAARTSLSLLFKETGGRLGIAEMRILAPGPGFRLVGAFLSDTVFVAASGWLREELPYKPVLSKRGRRGSIGPH
jgi:hypothetical protein